VHFITAADLNFAFSKTSIVTQEGADGRMFERSRNLSVVQRNWFINIQGREIFVFQVYDIGTVTC
jgi:hypothetical protein